MKTQKLGTVLFSAAGMLLLILDTQTAAAGAREGLQLCMRTLIPSLFPFFILSNLLTSSMLENNFAFLRPFGKLCRVSPGDEALVAVGFLGGYPVGAQNIALSLRNGTISQDAAKRMMAFCNNAGPAFLFGIIRPMFSSQSAVWLLWIIHIAGALAASFAIPSGSTFQSPAKRCRPLDMSRLMEQAVKTMANVCGWVIIFRIVLQFLDTWVLWRISAPGRVLMSGFFELSNGCVRLSEITNDGLRFLIGSVILAFGGLCVTMQTFSLCRGCDMSCYFPGKILQGAFSFLASYCMQLIVFPGSCIRLPVGVILFAAAVLLSMVFYLRKIKNFSSNSAPVVV